MVRFPHRADRVVDDFARLLPTLRATRRQVPEARTEIRSPEDCVHSDGGEQDDCSSGAIRPS